MCWVLYKILYYDLMMNIQLVIMRGFYIQNFEQFTLFTVENPLALNFNNNWCSLIFSSYTQFWTQKKNCRRHESRENCARILCRERRAHYWRQVQNVLLKNNPWLIQYLAKKVQWVPLMLLRLAYPIQSDRVKTCPSDNFL